MKKKPVLFVLLTLGISLILASCAGTDIIASTAVESFEAMVTTDAVRVDEDAALDAWSVQGPDDTIFYLGKRSDGELDTAIDLDATPFLEAGLKPEKLPENVFFFDENSQRLRIMGELGQNPLKGQTGNDITGTFKQWVETYRNAIGYHSALDHYGMDMGSGNMLEWAKNLDTNDKDLVFVLNPEPFISAGVIPQQLEGWIFAEVETMDKTGKAIMVEKFLKPFDLK